MNSPKLLEAIAELEVQRRIIDDAILHLKRAVTALSGGITAEVSTKTETARPVVSGAGASYVNEAVQAIQSAGHALHISKIVDFIASIRGVRPARASVESSLLRHIGKTKEPRLSKTGPSTYDLTVHSQRELPIAS